MDGRKTDPDSIKKMSLPTSRMSPSLSAFFVGCMATLMQVILFREQMVLLEGNELALSLMLVWWLVGIALGALLPKRLSLERHNGTWLCVSLFLLPIVLMICTALIRYAPWMLSIPSQEDPSPLQVVLISAFSVFPSSLLIGFTFPLVSISFKEHLSEIPGASAIANAFFFEAIGSAMGGVLLLLQVVPRWTPFEISAFSLVVLLPLFLKRIGRKASLCFFLSIVGLFVGNIPQKIDAWTSHARWQTRHEGFRFIRALETPYQRLELGERDGQYTVFGNGSPLLSYPDEYTYSQWAAMSLSQFPNPETILTIGNAGRELFPFYAQRPLREYLGIALDRGIHEIVGKPPVDTQNASTEHPGLLLNPTWAHSDAIRYLSGKVWQGHYGLIAVNQPDPSNAVINRYYTREFFQLLRESLTEDGVVVLTTTGTPNYEMGDVGFYCGTLYWTLRDVFPNVLVVPGMEWWFFASPSRSLLADPEAVIEQYKRLLAPNANFSPEIFRLYYDAARIEQMERAFQAYAHSPRNSDTRPLCYLYNLLLWSKQYGSMKWLPVESLAFAGWPLAGIGILGTFVLFLGAVGFARMELPHAAKGVSTPLAVLLLAGMSSMSAEIAIVLFYQSRVGYLYQHIGIFFGAFMLGLALGASNIMYGLFLNRRPAAVRLVELEAVYTFLLVITPILFTVIFSIPSLTAYIEILLLLWLMILAFVMGAILPTAARMIEEQGTTLLSMAGWVDAFDCAGGALGALITGLFLVPVIGLLNLFYILAGLNALCVLHLIRWNRMNEE